MQQEERRPQVAMTVGNYAKKQCRLLFTEVGPAFLIILLLPAIAYIFFVSRFLCSPAPSDIKSCINNLRQIQAGKEQWAIEFGQVIGDKPDFRKINHYIKGGAPTCPLSGTYSYNAVGTDATCTKQTEGHILP